MKNILPAMKRGITIVATAAILASASIVGPAHAQLVGPGYPDWRAVREKNVAAREAQKKVDDERWAKEEMERKLSKEEGRRAYQAEQKRKQEEIDARIADLQRKEAEQARIDNLPANRVFNGYMRFALVKVCHDIREGYLVQWVNDVELERANKAIKGIVEKAKAEDSSIDTDKEWDLALKGASKTPVSESWCQRAKNELLAMSPVRVYAVEKP